MSVSSRLSIAWVQCPGGLDHPGIARLRAEGLRVLRCAPGQDLDPELSLRVLPAALLGGKVSGMAASIPTLLIADDAEQEAALLVGLPPGSDVVRGLLPFELLLLRLFRLAERAGLLLPLPALQQDGLTPCLAQNAWAAQLSHLLAAAPGPADAVLLIDLDGFAAINQTLGHDEGDALLREMALRLSRQLAPSDRLGRLAGDSFGLLLRRYDRASLLKDAESLRRSAAELTVPGNRWLRRWQRGNPAGQGLTASAGLAWISEPTSLAALLASADAALRQAKREGRDRLQLGDDPGAPPAEPVAIDALTQAANRAHLLQRLQRELQQADRQQRAISLALLDPQGLQALNQSLGQAAGDRLLQTLAALLRGSARLTDWVARPSGGCLALLMPDTDAAGAAIARQRLELALSEAGERLPGLRLWLSTRQAGQDGPDWLQDCEAALQTAKRISAAA